jgi:prolyl oligopeptidase
VKRLSLLALLALLVPVFSSAQAVLAPAWKYPETRRAEVTDTYFGKSYTDGHRWLEDLKAPETEAWFKAQAELTDDLLGRIPGRDVLANEWMALDKLNPATYRAITWENGRVFYKKTLGGENVGKLYYRQGWKGAEKLLFDPSTYKAGVVTTIESVVPSWDGKFVALGFSSGGAEFSELRVLDVARGTLLPEKIYPSYGPLGWLKDGSGFFYDAGKVEDIKSPDIELNRKTRIHRLGAPVASDRDLFSNESNPELVIAPKEFPAAYIDESLPDHLLGFVSTVESEMRAYYAPVSQLKEKRIAWAPLCTQADKLVRGMAFHGGYAYAVTHAGAPKYRVVRTGLKKPDWSRAVTVIPEGKDSIQGITRSKDFLFATTSDGILGRIVKYDFKTGARAEVALPSSGDLWISCPDLKSNRCIVWVTGWLSPTTLYDYDADKGTATKHLFNSDVTYPGFDELVAEEVEVPGHDGTLIPLSIIHRKGLKLDGSHSAILDGYGAYGYSYTPGFNVRTSVALHDVVLAFAHVRGGSEKGEAWYRAGFKSTKPNTWKDFISCAEYLVQKGYTSPGKLGGTGTSAGGILISRAITDRPDLFAAAICNVGCCNAMRMEFSSNGPVNTPEFGTVQDPVEAAALYEMDGYQHVKPGVKYPAVLGVAGWNDPRVVPWEPGKFVAAVQAASSSGRPALLKVNYDNGHFTEEKLVTFKNFAGQFAFLLWQTGHPEFLPAAPSAAPAPAPAPAPAKP